MNAHQQSRGTLYIYILPFTFFFTPFVFVLAYTDRAVCVRKTTGKCSIPEMRTYSRLFENDSSRCIIFCANDEKKTHIITISRYPSHFSLTPHTVKLNIGGIRYETSVATVTNDCSSMLAAMFSGLFPLTPDPQDGSYFIDRDGTHFRYILKHVEGKIKIEMLIISYSHLRDRGLCDKGWIPPLEVNVVRELLQEAEFYQITSLIAILQAHLHSLEGDVDSWWRNSL